jgi:Lar family restriction alleviation protein
VGNPQKKMVPQKQMEDEVNKIESCPFCGSNNILPDTFNKRTGVPFQFRYQCQNCKASTSWFETGEAALGAWNLRPRGKPPVRKPVMKKPGKKPVVQAAPKTRKKK